MERGHKNAVTYGIVNRIVGAYSESLSSEYRSSGEGTPSKPWPGFCVFLRPFFVDGIEADDSGISNPFETWIESAIRYQLDIPLFAIGNEVRSGGGRVKVPSGMEWREFATMLMQAADVIVIWPSTTPGTYWEFDLCMRDFRDKTVFFSPSRSGKWGKNASVNRAVNNVQYLLMELEDKGIAVPNLTTSDTFWSYSQAQLNTAEHLILLLQKLGWDSKSFKRPGNAC